MAEKKKVLVCYATRQIDSNLMMSGTLFRGLQPAGYDAEAVICGPKHVTDFFQERYGAAFRAVHILPTSSGWLEHFCARSAILKLLYSFYIHFVKDGLWRPYARQKLRQILAGKRFETVLSFVPPIFSGRLGRDAREILTHPAKNANTLTHMPPPVRLIQFWTDPLSIGACNDITQIPKRRLLHRFWESRMLSYADKIVFCYPLLCEMEGRLHPHYAAKMSWSDVGYIEHVQDAFVPHNARITLGLFGAYQRKVRNIAPLLSAIRHFPNLRFILRGDSDLVIQAEEYPNLDVQPGRLPVAEVEALEAQCDILLCLGGHSGVTHPAGKLFYYASYHKPILYIGDGVHNDYFKTYLKPFGRYLICDNNEASICRGIEAAVAALPTYHHQIPERMHLDVIARKVIEG